MTAALRMWALARADFRERTRRFGFLLTLGFGLYAAYLFLPPNHHIYATLEMDGHRGIYNSAWIGTLVAMQTAVFLGLAGFYLVKNAITRDRRTRVGDILAATPVRNWQYLLGKYASNFAVLVTIAAVMIVAAAIMQLVRGESTRIEPAELILPFLFISVPVLSVVAALAVLFESIRWLRGGLGNVVYYFLWTAMIMTGALGSPDSGGFTDPVGLRLSVPSMQAGCQAAFPDYDPSEGKVSVGFKLNADGSLFHLETFEWNGIPWNAGHVIDRSAWFVIGVLLALLSTLAFDRFGAGARSMSRRDRKEPAHGEDPDAEPRSLPLPELEGVGAYASSPSTLTAVDSRTGRWRFIALVSAELRLLLKGVSLWWYLVAGGLAVACALVPFETARTMLYPLVWVWPILLWSPLGNRELQSGMDALLYSAPQPVWRQFPATWLAGVIIALVTGIGMAARFAVVGDAAALAALVTGALFVPALAMFLGVTSGTSKLFEIVYLILWYGGPLNGVAQLDFMGATVEGVEAGMSVIFAGATVALLVGTIVVRYRRLAR